MFKGCSAAGSAAKKFILQLFISPYAGDQLLPNRGLKIPVNKVQASYGRNTLFDKHLRP